MLGRPFDYSTLIFHRFWKLLSTWLWIGAVVVLFFISWAPFHVQRLAYHFHHFYNLPWYCHTIPTLVQVHSGLSPGIARSTSTWCMCQAACTSSPPRWTRSCTTWWARSTGRPSGPPCFVLPSKAQRWRNSSSVFFHSFRNCSVNHGRWNIMQFECVSNGSFSLKNCHSQFCKIFSPPPPQQNSPWTPRNVLLKGKRPRAHE